MGDNENGVKTNRGGALQTGLRMHLYWKAMVINRCGFGIARVFRNLFYGLVLTSIGSPFHFY